MDNPKGEKDMPKITVTATVTETTSEHQPKIQYDQATQGALERSARWVVGISDNMVHTDDVMDRLEMEILESVISREKREEG